jgi:hypothetical protein
VSFGASQETERAHLSSGKNALPCSRQKTLKTRAKPGEEKLCPGLRRGPAGAGSLVKLLCLSVFLCDGLAAYEKRCTRPGTTLGTATAYQC